MAQGCHLICSSADREHFPLDKVPESVDVEAVADQFKSAYQLPWNHLPSQEIVREGGTGIEIDPGKAALHGVNSERLETFTERFTRKGANPFVAGLLTARSDRQADILTGLGNPHLRDDMAKDLPKALEVVMRQDPKASGLFNAARAGASPWIANLKHPTPGSAAGIAYEVLATAKIVETGIKGLKLGPTDQLDFGRKLQASYGPGGEITTSDHSRESRFSQPDRKTVEADLLIKTPVSIFGDGKEIGVDFKYSTGKVQIEKEALEGVKVAIQTGEVDDWHYVSNASFSTSVVNQVEAINEELQASGHGRITLHTNIDW